MLAVELALTVGVVDPGLAQGPKPLPNFPWCSSCSARWSLASGGTVLSAAWGDGAPALIRRRNAALSCISSVPFGHAKSLNQVQHDDFTITSGSIRVTNSAPQSINKPRAAENR